MLKKELEKILSTAAGKISKEKISFELEYPRDPSHGDYACTVAMQLSKKLGKPPQDIANSIIDNVDKGELIESLEMAGPGFINIRASNLAYSKSFEKLLESINQKTFGKPERKKEKIILDYSQPNIAKPLGVHHLLSTVIGQCLSNIFRFQEYDTTSINYLGDWGTQFGKLIYAYRTWGDKKVIEKNPIPELLKLYVKFHNEAEKNPKLENEGREEFKKLEEGDEENTKLWEWVVEISMQEVQKTYEKLGGINFDHYWGEAHVRNKTASIIEDGKKKGFFKEGEEGALMMFFPNEKYPPFMIQKKDGTTLYSTRDLATLKNRVKEVDGGRIIYVVDVAQQLYFQQMFETAKLLGYTKNSQPYHVVFGRMQFPNEGMSTRKGKVVLLDELIDEAVKRATQKIEEHKGSLPNQEKKELAQMMGVGAVKYNVLSQNRQKNFTFDWNTMLSFEGNSAPYLQYAYTRTQSLLRKATDQKIKTGNSLEITKVEEKNLLKEMFRFESILNDVLTEYKPNILCNYLFELSQTFSLFYNNLSILNADSDLQKSTRIKLVTSFSHVLKTGLELLGIQVPSRM